MKVTVFTCTYNSPELLLRAMRSVPRHPDIEYIVERGKKNEAL